MKHFLMCAGLLAARALAADLPEPVLPAGMGVNIHFTKGREQDLDLIAAGGFKFIRMDFSWGGTERKQGAYDWSAYDELTANLEKHGLRAVYILDYSNGLYEETTSVTNKHTHHVERALCSPQHADSVAAFARWAGAAAAHFRGRHIIWEIWNEPNIQFWKPRPDVKQYTALALATVKAVRAADPQATIIAPGSSGFPWEFFETLFASGILKDIDAVSVHPYRGKPPETAAVDYEKLRALIARHVPAGKTVPIISGEWGYSTQHKGTPLALQGAYLPRQQLANLLAGVPLSVWYDWKNDGSDTNYNEHNFGTVTTKLEPKPSYLAAQELARELAGYRVARRLETANTNDWLLLCLKADGAQKIAAWTLAPPHAATLALTAKPLVLELADAPKYIALAQPEPRLALAAAWVAAPQGASLVSAAGGGKAVIRVRAGNPLAEPVTAKFSAEGFDGGAVECVLQLAPHAEGAGELAGCFTRRDRESLPVQVRAAIQGVSLGQALAPFCQRVEFIRADPLHLAVLPVAGGLRAVIENPARVAFCGSLQAGATKAAVQLATGATQARLALPDVPVSGAALTDERGALVAETTVPRMTAVAISAYRTALDGDSKIPAQARLAPATAPGPDAPFAQAFKLDYDFAAGWKFVRCVPDVKPRVALAGVPAAFGVWVWGDKSGNHLNARLADASGQTFQIGGPEIDWSGWRWLVFPVGGLQHASHWGGANDGHLHGALHWDCPLLLDSNRHSTTGTLYFAGLTLLDDVK